MLASHTADLSVQKDHQFQLLAPHGTAQKSGHVPQSIILTLPEFSQARCCEHFPGQAVPVPFSGEELFPDANLTLLCTAPRLPLGFCHLSPASSAQHSPLLPLGEIQTNADRFTTLPMTGFNDSNTPPARFIKPGARSSAAPPPSFHPAVGRTATAARARLAGHRRPPHPYRGAA